MLATDIWQTRIVESGGTVFLQHSVENYNLLDDPDLPVAFFLSPTESMRIPIKADKAPKSYGPASGNDEGSDVCLRLSANC